MAVRYLFDTDHISILQRRSGPEFGALVSRMAQHSPDDLLFSIVSFHEQMLGCNNYINQARTIPNRVHGYDMLAKLLADFAGAIVLPFDAIAASVCDNLISQRIRIGTMDLRIASIALASNLTLLTRNARDFGKVPGLLIEDWTV